MPSKNEVELVVGVKPHGTNEWLCVVAKRLPDGDSEVLTVGIEDSMAAAVAWGDGTIALMQQMGREDVQLPDKFDRRRPN